MYGPKVTYWSNRQIDAGLRSCTTMRPIAPYAQHTVNGEDATPSTSEYAATDGKCTPTDKISHLASFRRAVRRAYEVHSIRASNPLFTIDDAIVMVRNSTRNGRKRWHVTDQELARIYG